MFRASTVCWHANHEVGAAASNGHMQMSLSDQHAVKQYLEMGLHERRMQIMKGNADKAFFGQSAQASSGTSQYLAAWANGQKLFSLQQIETIWKQAKRLKQVDGSDAASVRALLNHHKDSVMY